MRNTCVLLLLLLLLCLMLCLMLWLLLAPVLMPCSFGFSWQHLSWKESCWRLMISQAVNMKVLQVMCTVQIHHTLGQNAHMYKHTRQNTFDTLTQK